MLRLVMSRLGTHRCPNGHMVAPSSPPSRWRSPARPAGGRVRRCRGAESFAFNSYGACPACDGLGRRIEVDPDSLIGDPDKTIEEGAVLPWNSGGRRLLALRGGAARGPPRRAVVRRLTALGSGGSCWRAKPVRKQVCALAFGQRPRVTLNVLYDNAVTAARALSPQRE